MASDQFSLHWDNFHNNMSSGMNSLLENEDLVDVTLAVEGKCLKAHKVVLSVCSPYFKELFKNNPCQHPIVFMKDVSYVALSDLLQFMYQGEVQVSQDNLTSFIKTAEALQIKGLTGENNGSNDTEVEVEKNSIAPVVAPPPQPTPQQEFRTEYKPLQKQRKVLQSQSQPTPSPKRARLSSDNSQLMTPVTKTEQLAPISTSNEVVQFKMEPYDQNQSISIDETPDETFGDDNTLDEANVDDTEDYSMMEGGEEEPQAGTSAEGAGEGQEVSTSLDDVKFKLIKRKPNMPRYIVDGFVFHVNITKGNPPMIYLRCLEYKRLGCHARAVIPYDGTIQDIKVNKAHNHPPDFAAEEKIVFMRELKEVMLKHPTVPSRTVYATLSEMYPNAARETPFDSIRHKMNRWRRQKDDVVVKTE
ncbi:protein tramtrack, beta isoform isoform X4 [Aethina tumida]|uniref:protein tramtrack, beta isoform isoform X4 n=1 Tax=Aethina tumida TaxID=116153 RepID=UPI002147511E|nr:protein tramtrack, beta isoform isoform X4 [Aethina tumida]